MPNLEKLEIRSGEVFDANRDQVVLTCIDASAPDNGDWTYVLVADDPYGAAPLMRQRLHEWLEAGNELTGGLPNGWPWYAPPPAQTPVPT